jgi:uncharacterized protein (TIGR02145 family)
MRKQLFTICFSALVFMACDKNENDANNNSPETNDSSFQFNPNLTYGIMNDNDGHTYKTIQIGAQTWMAENLRTTKYRNGTSLVNITDSVAWKDTKEGAWCYYNNDLGNDTLYGKLYNWYAVIDSGGLCPSGWHVPTDAEWNVLAKQVDPSADTTLCCNNAAGGSMKSTGTQYWESPNRNATNSSGFSGLPGGSRSLTSTSFTYFEQTGYWWSSTETIIKTGQARFLFYFDGALTRFNADKSNGFSVRCLKD